MRQRLFAISQGGVKNINSVGVGSITHGSGSFSFRLSGDGLRVRCPLNVYPKVVGRSGATKS